MGKDILKHLTQDIAKCQKKCNEDWGDRFQIKILNTCSKSRHVNCDIELKDNLLGETETKFATYSMLGNKYMFFEIWNGFNSFVLKQLAKRRK